MKTEEDMKREILKLLEADADTTTAAIAEKTGLTEEAVRNEIDEMTEAGIICGSSAVINWDKVDKTTVTALIEVKVTPQRGDGFDKIAQRIYHNDEVRAVFLMSGGYDLCVMVEGKDIREVSMFVSDKLARINDVISTATHFVLKTYKDHGIIMDEQKSWDERKSIWI